MPETEFRVKYDGPALRDGRMEVRDLAPALLALADLFREADALVNPDQPPISLHIQATDTGSFDVILALVLPDVLDQAVSFFAEDAATALVNMKELVIGSSYGLFRVIKWLRNRSVSSQERLPNGMVRLSTAEGDSIDIPSEAAQLHRNARIRRRTREVIQPLTREGIDTVDFYVERTSEVSVEITDGDVDAFEPPSAEVEPVLDTETTMALAIVAPGLDEGYKWRLSDGDRPSFFASVADAAFLDRVDNGEAFRKGDILTCSLRVVQTRTEEGGLHTEYTVTRVHEHIPRSRPIQLSLGDVERTEASDLSHLLPNGGDKGRPIELGEGLGEEPSEGENDADGYLEGL
jgi:hypothetical protein